MPSSSISIEYTVIKRLDTFKKNCNKNRSRTNKIESRTEIINELLSNAGF